MGFEVRQELTKDAGERLLEVLIRRAEARVVLGATVVLFEDVDTPGIVIFEDGGARYLGPPVRDKDAGDGIVAAAQREGPSARAAVTPGPGFASKSARIVRVLEGMEARASCQIDMIEGGLSCLADARYLVQTANVQASVCAAHAREVAG